MVTRQQIKNGLVRFMDTELMPHLGEQSPVKQIVIATGIGIMLRSLEPMIDKFAHHPMVGLLGVADKDGHIDIDLIAEELRPNIPRDGLVVDIPLVGEIKLFPEDVDSILNHIKNS